MPNKKQLYAEMFEQTAERVTKSLSDWTGFLDVVGKLYKYPFHEQLMIYARRPMLPLVPNTDCGTTSQTATQKRKNSTVKRCGNGEMIMYFTVEETNLIFTVVTAHL